MRDWRLQIFKGDDGTKEGTSWAALDFGPSSPAVMIAQPAYILVCSWASLRHGPTNSTRNWLLATGYRLLVTKWIRTLLQNLLHAADKHVGCARVHCSAHQFFDIIFVNLGLSHILRMHDTLLLSWEENTMLLCCQGSSSVLSWTGTANTLQEHRGVSWGWRDQRHPRCPLNSLSQAAPTRWQSSLA